MKIGFLEAIANRHGQFFVRAESEEDKEIIQRFLGGMHENLPLQIAWIDYDGKSQPKSFDFGWNGWKESEDTVKVMEEKVTVKMMNFGGKPKSKKLFLDDRPRRIESVMYSDDWDVTIATNVKQCLRYLSRVDFDEVWLENDLGGEEFIDTYRPEAGMEVVRYIQTTGWPPSKRKPIFRVHSSNLFAAYLMVRTLQEMGLIAVYEPFEEGA